MTVPETATTNVTAVTALSEETPGPTHAVWAAEQVAGELREAYLTVAAAAALLQRTSDGSAHPALRQARRCGEDALDAANYADQFLGLGIRSLHDQLGRSEATSIGQVTGALDVSRTQFAEAAERIAGLPHRIDSARQQLHDATGPDLATASVLDHWSQAAQQLGLMTASLTEAAGALAAYTDRLTGATS